jgi:N-acetylglucosaminyl-diphospho-decaprenol L-rhamnosyltransferase
VTNDPVTGPSAPRAALGIIVVNYGSHELIAANLARLDPPASDTHIVIVDNFFSTAERQAIARVAGEHGWPLVEMAENVGFGIAMNIGVDRATDLGCENFLLLNPDAFVSWAAIDSMRADCDKDPMVMVAPTIVRPDGKIWFRGNVVNRRNGSLRGADDFRAAGPDGWLTGACLLVNRRLWDKMGGFDPDYFLYWEDVDLSHRCWEVGGRLLVRFDLIATHDVGGTQPTDSDAAGKSSIYVYYNCRNRLVYASKHLRGSATVWWILTTPVQSFHILSRIGRRQLVRSPRHVWSAVSGSLNGFAFAGSALLCRLMVNDVGRASGTRLLHRWRLARGGDGA